MSKVRMSTQVYDDYLDQLPYSSIMTANEEFTYERGRTRTYFLDPNGANRNFNPSGAFIEGFLARVVNVGGAFNIIFDSVGSAQVLTPGAMGTFIYHGTSWL